MRMALIFAGGAGLAALAAAAPATAQYNPYGYGYGYNANLTQYAVNRCTAAVNNRLFNRTGVAGVIGSLVGAHASGRVVAVTQVTPRRSNIRVRGLATSGRMAYNPYGYGYYGALGSAYAQPADLSFSCTVDYRGRIRDIDINRRR